MGGEGGREGREREENRIEGGKEGKVRKLVTCICRKALPQF